MEKLGFIAAAIAFLVIGSRASLNAQVVLTDGSYTYNQNFSSIPYGFDGQWTNNSTLQGWYYTPTFGEGSSTDVRYIWTQGGNPTPGLQLYTNAEDPPTIRGLGSLTSGSVVGGYNVSQVLYGFQTLNSGSMTVSEISLAFNQLQWFGGTAASLDSVQFAYSLDATSLTTGTWTTVSALSLGGFVDGEGGISLVTTPRSASITGLELANGQSIWFRWTDNDIDGGDAGAGISNLSMTAVPEPQVFALLGLAALVLVFRRRRNVCL